MNRSANLINKGSILNIDGSYYRVEEFSHTKPGKGHAFIRVKLRDIVKKIIIDKKIQSNSKVDIVDYNTFDLQFLYREGDNIFNFLNTKTHEMHRVDKDIVVGNTLYLVDESVVCTAYITNDNEIISINLPNNIVVEVKKTGAGSVHDRVSTSLKIAVASNGINVKIPSFIKEGDRIKISTETGEYMEKLSQ